jgi:NAD(P)-dependent dehydrogenase (short-subunit alcohol dehydrogenase family)
VNSPRTILITGASSGIGLGAARTLTERGWLVFASARKPADLEMLRRDLGVEPVQLDLAEEASIGAAVARVLEATGGRLDALFNNAAYGQVGAIEDLSATLLRRQIDVNLIGTHDLTRRLIPAMRRQGHGRIIQCSSVLGFMAAPYRGAYCASKFALEALSDALRMELAGTGIHVSIIAPGPIRSRFLETALANFRATIDIPSSPHRDNYERRLAAMERGGKQTFKLEPEAVVRRLIQALDSPRPKPRYFVTTPTYLGAVAKRLLPTVLMDRLASTQ